MAIPRAAGPQDLMPELLHPCHQNDQSKTVDITRRETEAWKSKLAHNKVGSYSVLAKPSAALPQHVDLRSHQGFRVWCRWRPWVAWGTEWKQSTEMVKDAKEKR